MEDHNSRCIPRAGSFYRHFKGSLFQIVGNAFYSENEEEMVVYQALYPPYQLWVRPLHSFLARVDKTIYPDAMQDFLFEEIVFETHVAPTENSKPLSMEETESLQQDFSEEVNPQKNDFSKKETDQVAANNQPVVKEEYNKMQQKEETKEEQAVDDKLLHRALQSGNAETYLEGKIEDSEVLQRGLLMILDAANYSEKRDLLVGLHPYLTEPVLCSIAMAHDITLQDGDLETQYHSLLECLETLEHYEGGRLR